MLFGLLVGLVIIGRNNIFITILLCFYGIEIFFEARKVIFKRKEYRLNHMLCKVSYEFLEEVHKIRYEIYLSSDTAKAEEYSEIIDDVSNAVLTICEVLLKEEISTQKEQKEIQDIASKTKKLMKNIQPFI